MAEINISELSIGDWVKIGGDYFQIYHLTLAGDVYGYRKNKDSLTGEEYYDGELSDVEPIPLTPEILEKNGISKTYESDEYAVYKGEGFNVTEYYTELCDFERHRNRLMIRNVHQLQHALRLAGVEKEIEL